ncbi:MAG: ABC transporter permease [Spirochaetia bacterium]|nr:ABC transporter permease [Spirochaetia bacterium]
MHDTLAIQSDAKKKRKETQFVLVSRRVSKNPTAMLGFVVAVLLLLMAVFAPLIIPYPIDEQDLFNTRSAPTKEHLFGTDELGRDVLSRVIYGSRFSLSIGILSVLVGTSIGMFFGAIAGYFGGLVDNIIMRCIDIVQSIPGILLAITVSVVLGPGFFNSMLALAIGAIPMSARLLRASILGIRTEEYLEAATSINASTTRIIVRHVLPNCFAPVLVSATMMVGHVILGAAMLSFIGLGIQPPTPEWGAMIAGGRSLIRSAPHMVTFPGIFIMLAVLSVNLFGDGLRDALDPKLKK